MTLSQRNYRHLTFFSGNKGTAGTAQQSRGFQRSLIRHESGNKGTQLCLIESLPPCLVPAQKTPGTSSHSERPVLEPLYPRSRVPTDFEFSRVNKGGDVLFLLTEPKSFVPRNSSCPITTDQSALTDCRPAPPNLAGLGL